MSSTAINIDVTASQGPQHLRALVELAVRASGARGGTLRLAADDSVVRTGDLCGASQTLELTSSGDALLGHLDLHGADAVDGIDDLVASLVDDVSRRRGRQAVEGMRSRIVELERELHHRTGNILQTVASFLRMQAEDFDSRSDATVEDARILVEDARVRVMVVGAVQATMELALREDTQIDTDVLLEALCVRLAQILPGQITFTTDLENFPLARQQASAFGITVAEFALAAVRDAFPKPADNRIHIRTALVCDDGRDTIALTLRHEADGYDTSAWSQGSPVLTGRIVEAVATQMDGLVAIDRSNGEVESGRVGQPAGMRLRLVFDRPAVPHSAPEEVVEPKATDPSHSAPETSRTFDTRLGVRTGALAMRKS